MSSLWPAKWPQTRRFDRRHRRYLRYAEQALDRDWNLFGDLLITLGPVRAPRSRRAQALEREEWRYQPQLLEGVDPGSDPSDAGLAMTALQYADDDGLDERVRYLWESYAHRGLRRLLGPGHPDTLRAASSLAITCGPERADEAIALHQEIVEQHARHGRLADAEQARLDLAMALHRAGRCRPAIQATLEVWQRWCLHQRPGRRGACRPSRRRQFNLGVHIGAQALYLLRRCDRVDVAKGLLYESLLYLPRKYVPGSSRVRQLPWCAQEPGEHERICTFTAADPATDATVTA